MLEKHLLCQAGHGSQTQDWQGEEDDGYNETLCPCDFKQVLQLTCSCCALHTEPGSLRFAAQVTAVSMSIVQAAILSIFHYRIVMNDFATVYIRSSFSLHVGCLHRHSQQLKPCLIIMQICYMSGGRMQMHTKAEHLGRHSTCQPAQSRQSYICHSTNQTHAVSDQQSVNQAII